MVHTEQEASEAPAFLATSKLSGSGPDSMHMTPRGGREKGCALPDLPSCLPGPPSSGYRQECRLAYPAKSFAQENRQVSPNFLRLPQVSTALLSRAQLFPVPTNERQD